MGRGSVGLAGVILACTFAGCGGKGSPSGKVVKGAERRPVATAGREEPGAEDALGRLDSNLTSRGREDQASELVVSVEARFPTQPVAGDFLLAGTTYLTSMDYRNALAAFQRAQTLDADKADPHWGRGVVLYCVAVLDMAARGRAKVEKRPREEMARLMAAHSYRRREALLMGNGYVSFGDIRSRMDAQGWTEGEAIGAVMAAVTGAPGTPDDPEMSKIAKEMAVVVPRVTFEIDDPARAVLRLADAAFRRADDLPGFEGARHRYFLRPEMRSVHGRVKELLGGGAP